MTYLDVYEKPVALFFFFFQNKMTVISTMNCTLLKVQCAGFSGIIQPTKPKQSYLSLAQIQEERQALKPNHHVMHHGRLVCKMVDNDPFVFMIWAIWANRIWKVSFHFVYPWGCRMLPFHWGQIQFTWWATAHRRTLADGSDTRCHLHIRRNFRVQYLAQGYFDM